MARIISIHSYRGGTGKSNIIANVAYLLAQAGRRVAVLDTDLQSPGVHLLFDIERTRLTYTLSDFVQGRCEIQEAAYNLRSHLPTSATGALYLLPSTMTLEAITQIIASGYDAEKLNRHFGLLSEVLKLDLLLLDTHPGFNRETLLTAAISDLLIVVLRPDRQDFYGTALVLELAARLAVPDIYLLANKVVGRVDEEGFQHKLKHSFGYDVLASLPLSQELAKLGSKGLFVRQFPQQPISLGLQNVANRLLRELPGSMTDG